MYLPDVYHLSYYHLSYVSSTPFWMQAKWSAHRLAVEVAQVLHKDITPFNQFMVFDMPTAEAAVPEWQLCLQAGKGQPLRHRSC